VVKEQGHIKKEGAKAIGAVTTAGVKPRPGLKGKQICSMPMDQCQN